MKQFESGFKRTINWNKYHPKFKTFSQNRYLNYLIDPSFQGVNGRFVLPFEDETDKEVCTKHALLTEEIKYNVIVNERNFNQQKMILKHMITLERWQLVKEMITQLNVY